MLHKKHIMKAINRKDFLKKMGLAGVTIAAAPVLMHCRTDDNSSSSENASCSVTDSETAGPFPTKTPSSLVRTNIVGDRTGIPLTIAITVQNTNNSCAALQGALVDIWHCDKEGNYSEYGGTSLQSTDYTSNHFLRGRQTTDSNGLVNFTSIFPGWYTGRATHIHVHIYKSDGTSLLVTQIAFPEGSSSAVVLVNATSGYKPVSSSYTYNANDNVFSDGTSNEMSSITGSVSAGFALTHTIKVAG